MPKGTTNGRASIVDVDVHLHWQTERAIRISTDGEDKNAVWLAKSMLGDPDEEFDVGKTIRITIAEGLAYEKGLV